MLTSSLLKASLIALYLAVLGASQLTTDAQHNRADNNSVLAETELDATPQTSAESSFGLLNFHHERNHHENLTESQHHHHHHHHQSDNSSLKIIVYSTWVSDEPLDKGRLNHRQYCNALGYEYRHYHFTMEEWKGRYAGIPAAWANVLVTQMLLDEFRNASKDVWIVKLDIDCVFATTEISLESFILPLKNRSLILTETDPNTPKFTQSHAWMFKNTKFSHHFVSEWLELMTSSHCKDLAYEQGAMVLTLGYFSLIHAQAAGLRYSPYDCLEKCFNAHTGWGTWHFHHCVLDWFVNNKLHKPDVSIHPEIYIVPYAGKSSDSPEDGFTFEVQASMGNPYKDHLMRPLTLHPCKDDPYVPPRWGTEGGVDGVIIGHCTHLHCNRKTHECHR